MIDGHWFSVRRNDPRAYGLWARHYSAGKSRRWRETGSTEFIGPGEVMVLLSDCSRALFAWQRNTIPRLDAQTGVCCTVFRNESPVLSSELIREADALAWQRWPGERHFTYVDPAKVRRKRDPGRCFLRAGWRVCGTNADGRLRLLEVLEAW
jgi:hypothetical protein